MSEAPGPGKEGAPEDPPARRRLDPERAAAERRAARHAPPPVIDTRPYQRMIGLFGLLLVVVISITFLSSRGTATVGVPAGQKLPVFAAPLASSTLNGAANLKPVCSEAGHDSRALNICLRINRGPLVLAFFVTSSGGCQRAVDALQQVYKTLAPGQLQVAAVAIRTSHADAARAVRERRWTIPVAYDVDGRVGATYGIGVCPVFELAQRGGLVKRRLIGESWASAATLGPQVRALLAR